MKITTTEKISIGGMRFSSEQIQLSFPGLTDGLHTLVLLLRKLTDKQVNLPFLCFDSVLGNQATVSMSPDDFNGQRTTVEDFGQSAKIRPDATPSIGSLTLFPHKSRTKIVGLFLEILGRNKLTLHSLNSSLSALVANIDYQKLSELSFLLQESFVLPDNHSPFRQKFEVDECGGGSESSSPVIETEAVYWEPVIKIYGSCIKRNLTLMTAHLADDKLSLLGSKLQTVDGGNGSFEMISIQRIDNHRFLVSLLCENRLTDLYRGVFECENLLYGIDRRPGELLYVHGPHFQDRYGVAYAALDGLSRKQQDVYAVGCSGTSIYLITPEKKGQPAADALAKVFLVPRLS